MTPQQYAEVVAAHSKLDTDSTLYPGRNFDRLGSYLLQPFKTTRGSSPARQSVYGPPQRDSFVTRYTLYPSGERAPIEKIQKVEELKPRRQSTVANSENGKSSAILFLRGRPSSEFLAHIGAMYRIDPEFFQRHLDFHSTTGRLNYFPLPSLRSSSSYIIRLRYMTLGQWNGQGENLGRSAVDVARRDSEKEMIKYRNLLNLSIERDQDLGDSIVRAFLVVDEKHFALEQEISICVNRSESGWTGRFAREGVRVCCTN